MFTAPRNFALEVGDTVESVSHRDGRIVRIRGNEVRAKMRDNGEIEVFSAGNLTYVPSAREVQSRSASVRAGWDTWTEWARRAVKNPGGEIAFWGVYEQGETLVV